MPSPTPPPSRPKWVSDALKALGLLLLAAGLIIFLRFIVIFLYAAGGAILIVAGVALLKSLLR
jgi:hypothetical protein